MLPGKFGVWYLLTVEPSTELKISEKATNGQRNILKNLEKGWKIIALDHFQKPTIKSGSLEEKY